MNKQESKKLGKTISLALRHQPELFHLSLDEEGWTPLEALFEALSKRRREWIGLTESDLRELLRQSEKQRFEIRDGRIRAFYGHSIETKIHKETTAPPEFLFHGTPPQVAETILHEGLRPMGRQYVHLSVDEKTARIVGARRCRRPTILRVAAEEAYKAGIPFYTGNDGTWLSDPIPPKFIELMPDLDE
jgi:putative RNA 2'-phosphotransferase